MIKWHKKRKEYPHGKFCWLHETKIKNFRAFIYEDPDGGRCRVAMTENSMEFLSDSTPYCFKAAERVVLKEFKKLAKDCRKEAKECDSLADAVEKAVAK